MLTNLVGSGQRGRLAPWAALLRRFAADKLVVVPDCEAEILVLLHTFRCRISLKKSSLFCAKSRKQRIGIFLAS
jgi:hypothetical protein